MEEKKKAAEESQAKKPGILKRRFSVIIVVLLVQAAASYFLVTQLIAPKIKGSKADREKQIGSVYLVKDVITNPAQTAGTRFLNVTVGLEAEGKHISDELGKRDPQIRDILIDILASKTIEQLIGIESRKRIREDILSQVNKVLITGKVVNVYFVSFVLQ